MKSYDVLVLGGGTAGSAAAKAAHEAGAKTAMFNAGELGGLCILRGCMPTKTMLHSAHLIHQARHHGARGIETADVGFDFQELMANKDAKVSRFQRAKVDSIESGGYEVIDAIARFVGPDTVEAGGETYQFTSGAVIAVGSEVTVPPVEGLDSIPYLTSDDLMRLEQAPESILVYGSGAIGLEFAQFFSRLGTEVQLVSRRNVMTDVDAEISDEMGRVLDDEPNLKAHHGVTLRAVRQVEGGIEAVCQNREGEELTLRTEQLVLATGRKPAIDDLGLDAAYVDSRDGKVLHSAEMRTTNPSVWVAGDATGQRLLLHVANWEGRAAGLGAAKVPGDHAVDHRLHMSVVFFDPPMAQVGLNAEEARQAGHQVVTASAYFAETGRAITMDVPHGVWKVVADKQSGEILGSQILGPRADDLIHIVSAVMHFHGTTKDLLAMPWYHPTLSEVLLSLARQLDS